MATHFREIILHRLRQLKKSRYWLAEQVSDSVSRSAVYDFLRGESDMQSSHIERILDALGLEVSAKNTPQKG